MKKGRPAPITDDARITALNELIDALDHRVPHVERAGELQIADEAATLRQDAVARIDALKGHAAHPDRSKTAEPHTADRGPDGVDTRTPDKR